jgi:hypothetical protein
MPRTLLLIALLAACGKSDEQVLREKTACIYATTGEQVNYYAYEECLWLQYKWSRDDAHKAATDLAAMNAKYRADSIRQANVGRKRT